MRHAMRKPTYQHRSTGRVKEVQQHYYINKTNKTEILFLHTRVPGVQAYADAQLVIIKVLAQNSGLDPQEAIVKLQEEYTGPGQAAGLDIKTGEALIPVDTGIVDNYREKKQLLHSW